MVTFHWPGSTESLWSYNVLRSERRLTPALFQRLNSRCVCVSVFWQPPSHLLRGAGQRRLDLRWGEVADAFISLYYNTVPLIPKRCCKQHRALFRTVFFVFIVKLYLVIFRFSLNLHCSHSTSSHDLFSCKINAISKMLKHFKTCFFIILHNFPLEVDVML